MKHKHYDLIMEWASDTTKVVQFKTHIDGVWEDLIGCPNWHEDWTYRIKPEPKPDVVFEVRCVQVDAYPELRWPAYEEQKNLRLTFDGETGKLKDALYLIT